MAIDTDQARAKLKALMNTPASSQRPVPIRMSFGPYMGSSLQAVPKSYLVFLARSLNPKYNHKLLQAIRTIVGTPPPIPVPDRKVKVKGVSHHRDAVKLSHVGDQIKLVLDPLNEYDPYAVKVINQSLVRP